MEPDASPTDGNRTFPKFLQLPAELRRPIWLMATGPVTLFFDMCEWRQGEDGEMEVVHLEDVLPRDSQGRPCHGFPSGFVALEDGTSYMSYRYQPPAAYHVCRESRGFLQFHFAKLVPAGGGLPRWFRFDTDAICCSVYHLDTIGNHAWFTQTQHLVVCMEDINEYLFGDFDTRPVEKGHDWIEDKLLKLEELTLDLSQDSDNGQHWLADVFGHFEAWYNPREEGSRRRFRARAIRDDLAETEWLTSTNYLSLCKQVLQSEAPYLWESYCGWGRVITNEKLREIRRSTDEELLDPSVWFARHRRRLEREGLAEEPLFIEYRDINLLSRVGPW